MNKVCLIGGTFNPIHIAHLIIAEEIRQKFHFKKVLFIPSAYPPHKNIKEIIDISFRYQMTKLAIASNPFFDISAIEMNRKGFSYSIETLREFKKNYGEKTEFFFLIGLDAILEISTWKEEKQLFKMCRFIVVPRTGYDLSKLKPEIKNQIEIVEITQMDISSTKIRKMVKEGKSIKYLVTPEVEEYIKQKELYK